MLSWTIRELGLWIPSTGERAAAGHARACRAVASISTRQDVVKVFDNMLQSDVPSV
jgi:hypothetical protein